VMTTGVVLTFAACTRRHVLPARPIISPPAEKARITRLDFEASPYPRAGQDQFPLGIYWNGCGEKIMIFFLVVEGWPGSGRCGKSRG